MAANRTYKKRTTSSKCLNCGKEFSYERRTGAMRKHCSADCRAKYRAIQRVQRISRAGPCSVDGCKNKAERTGAELCDTHYIRLRRTGTTDPRKPSYRYSTAAGYIKLLLKDHPLSDSKGNVYEHRKVAYEKHGGICPPCFWCGAQLSWDSAVVDHLDEDKANNEQDNLEVACNSCNRARGAMLPFISSVKDESFSKLIQQMVKYKAGASKR